MASIHMLACRSVQKQECTFW